MPTTRHGTAESAINKGVIAVTSSSSISWRTTCSLKIGAQPLLSTTADGQTSSVIDLTITNQAGHDLVENWKVLEMGDDRNSSDHNFITFCTKSETTARPNFRDISKTNWEVYEEKLAELMGGKAQYRFYRDAGQSGGVFL